MLRYWGVTSQVISRTRFGGLNRGADLLDQRSLRLQSVQLKIAQDEMKLGFGCRAAHLVEMDEALATFGRLRREGDLGQRVDDLGGQVQRVDQLVLGLAGMDGDAGDRHRGLVGREGLVDDLALFGPVQRVGEVCIEIFQATSHERHGRSPHPA